jgi:cytoskeletal protein RodZ
MNQERVDFGSRLREERESRTLSLTDVARVTKIPSRALEQLEAGRFDDLPADVFVRGFIRSYCRTVGLSSEDVLRQYGELTRSGDKVRRETLTKPAPREPRPRPTAREAREPQTDVVRVVETRPEVARRTPTEEQSLLTQALSDAKQGTRRVSLTLAVIILVIVATLTLSLLLRRPSHVGDGISLGGGAPPVAALLDG